MIRLWILIGLLIFLAFLDFRAAFAVYKVDRKTFKLILHGILLLVLVVLVVNTVFVAMNSEFEVPYFNVYISSRTGHHLVKLN